MLTEALRFSDALCITGWETRITGRRAGTAYFPSRG